MTEWLLENREWLGTAIPFSAFICAIIFWLLSDGDKPKNKQLESRPNTISLISNIRGHSISDKLEFPILMPDYKRAKSLE